MRDPGFVSEPAWDSDKVKVLFEVLFDTRVLLARIVEFIEAVMAMEKKKRKKLTNREWWEKYGEQFERTDRHLRETIASLEKKVAEEKAARGETAA